MHASSFFTRSVLIASVSAIPAQVEKRNACDWKDVEPILYHTYDNAACPPKFKPDSKGICPIKPTDAGFNKGYNCGAFCEKTTEYKYGRESIFLANPYCHGPMTCGITDTATTTVSTSINFNVSPKLTDLFTLGISGGRTSTSGLARAQSKSVNLKQGECGYFTFLPIEKTTCGTWTEGKPNYAHEGPDPRTCIDQKTDKNHCVTQPTKRPGIAGDDAAGDTIFVRVDCSNHKPLPMDQQDPAYRHDGVPLDRESYEALAEFFDGGDRLESSIECRTSDTSPTMGDCATAMDSFNDYADLQLQYGTNGNKFWAGYYQSCAIQIEYSQDWPRDACGITLAEVGQQAARMFDKCKNDGLGKIGALRRFRDDGKCDSWLRITHTEGLPPSPVTAR